MSYESFLNQTATVYRKSVGTGKPIEDWVYFKTVKCMVVSVSPTDILMDDLRSMKVDYKVFIPVNTGIENGDKFVVSGYSLINKRIDDIAFMNRVILCWTSKI
jgi:hypothetical protein